jgi:hypothetical protein
VGKTGREETRELVTICTMHIMAAVTDQVQPGINGYMECEHEGNTEEENNRQSQAVGGTVRQRQAVACRFRQ